MPKSVTSPSAGKQDEAERRKKNANAQAAFRARRANYIATLEDTVSNLESVVLQLQDSCRETRNHAEVLIQENKQLRFQLEEREKYWKAIWPRKSGSDNDDPPPPPPTFSQPSAMNISRMQYGDGMSYRTGNEDPAAQYSSTNGAATHSYAAASPTLSYTGPEGNVSGSDSSCLVQRVPKYPPYYHTLPPDSRDNPWPQPITQSSSSGGDSTLAAGSNHSSHSPGFVESPTLASPEMAFPGRFPVEEQKVSMALDTMAPYSYSGSRSISPSSSTPPSASATSLHPTFPFTFPDPSASHDRGSSDYHRQSLSHHSEVAVHGRTADVSLKTPGTDDIRYRLTPTASGTATDSILFPVLPGLSNSEAAQNGMRDPDSTKQRLRPRRSAAGSHSSRSPSPGGAGGPTLSGTLAVIKAQAFGALRRSRARKSGEGSSKMSIDAYESPGPSTGVKRPRLDDDGR